MMSPKRSVEDIREGEAKSPLARKPPAPDGAAAHAALEGGVAEAVVGGLLLLVLEDVVGLADLLEAALRLGVVLVAVGVELLGLGR
jgi:hypothetical protein